MGMVRHKADRPARGSDVERRTRSDYFEAGLELLAEGGVGATTIANLCDRLQVTKGSFYHHFSSGPDYQAALLDHWAGERADQLRAQVASVPEPLARIDVLKRLAVGIEHEAESAIRAWARTDPVAAKAQRAVDEEREDLLDASFRELGLPAARSRTLARIGVTVLVGSQQLEDHVDRARLATLFDEYQRWLLAALPS